MSGLRRLSAADIGPYARARRHHQAVARRGGNHPDQVEGECDPYHWPYPDCDTSEEYCETITRSDQPCRGEVRCYDKQTDLLVSSTPFDDCAHDGPNGGAGAESWDDAPPWDPGSPDTPMPPWGFDGPRFGLPNPLGWRGNLHFKPPCLNPHGCDEEGNPLPHPDPNDTGGDAPDETDPDGPNDTFS